MTDYVVDTNVWVMVDRIHEADLTPAELNCIERCRDWLYDFVNGSDRLVVDYDNLILGKYRRNLTLSGQARRFLRRLELQPLDRLVYVAIALDENGHAIIPFAFTDPNDRKFIAVALAHNPTPTIINATDSDWHKDRQALEAAGLTIEELCPDFIAKLLARRDK